MTSPHDLKFREELAGRLATIEVGQRALSDKLDLQHSNLQLQLAPLLELHVDVKEHDRQISRWKGANAILAVIITGVFAFLGKLKLLHW